MKSVLIILALATALVGNAQRRGTSNNKYDINYSAKELAGRVAEPKVSLFEGLLSGEAVDFSVSVNKDMKAVTVLIFPNGGMVITENNRPQNFYVRSRNERVTYMSGRVQQLGSTQFLIDISTLPQGNYVLTMDGLQTGQPITFSNY